MRYQLQPSTPVHWICTDTKYKIACRFKSGSFNESQEMTMLTDFNPDNIKLLAQIMREMGDWLRANHYDKLF